MTLEKLLKESVEEILGKVLANKITSERYLKQYEQWIKSGRDYNLEFTNEAGDKSFETEVAALEKFHELKAELEYLKECRKIKEAFDIVIRRIKGEL